MDFPLWNVVNPYNLFTQVCFWVQKFFLLCECWLFVCWLSGLGLTEISYSFSSFSCLCLYTFSFERVIELTGIPSASPTSTHQEESWIPRNLIRAFPGYPSQGTWRGKVPRVMSSSADRLFFVQLHLLQNFVVVLCFYFAFFFTITYPSVLASLGSVRDFSSFSVFP